MSLYTTEIPEGLRFEDKEEALHYFESTLVEGTKLGTIFEDLHAHDWRSYSIQATGDQEQFNILLDNPNLTDKFFKRVNVNTYGANVEVTSEELIEQLEQLIKTTEFAAIIALDQIEEIKEAIDKKTNTYLNDVINFEESAFTVSTEVDNQGARTVLGFSDPTTEEVVSNYIPLKNGTQLTEEEIKAVIKGFFLRKIEGKFKQNFTADDIPMNHILDYAVREGKTVVLEIVD